MYQNNKTDAKMQNSVSFTDPLEAKKKVLLAEKGLVPGTYVH